MKIITFETFETFEKFSLYIRNVSIVNSGFKAKSMLESL